MDHSAAASGLVARGKQGLRSLQDFGAASTAGQRTLPDDRRDNGCQGCKVMVAYLGGQAGEGWNSNWFHAQPSPTKGCANGPLQTANRLVDKQQRCRDLKQEEVRRIGT